MDRTREEAEANAAFDPKLLEPYIIKDPQALTINAAKALENLGKAASVWLKPRETGEIVDPVAEPYVEEYAGVAFSLCQLDTLVSGRCRVDIEALVLEHALERVANTFFIIYNENLHPGKSVTFGLPLM